MRPRVGLPKIIEIERDLWGVTLSGEATREAPAQAELRPPMVCVKLPKSVLGLFHLLEQRSCHFLRIEVQGR
jgi:hypothetical protein